MDPIICLAVETGGRARGRKASAGTSITQHDNIRAPTRLSVPHLSPSHAKRSSALSTDPSDNLVDCRLPQIRDLQHLVLPILTGKRIRGRDTNRCATPQCMKRIVSSRKPAPPQSPYRKVCVPHPRGAVKRSIFSAAALFRRYPRRSGFRVSGQCRRFNSVSFCQSLRSNIKLAAVS